MSFVIVEYLITLTRDEVIRLIIDNEKVETVTSDGEKIVLMGSGTHKKVPDDAYGGFKHVFGTTNDFKDHDKYLWTSVNLIKLGSGAYSGIITVI